MNVVLIGFRGAGKSTLGKSLAEKLSLHFLDLDAAIVEKAGRPLPEIFEKFGEAGFRKLEAAAIAGLAGTQDSVIACGGGAVLDPENVRQLRALGKVIHLTASPEALHARLLRHPQARPKLTALDDFEEVKTLAKGRKTLYEAAADGSLDTTKLSVEEAAKQLAALAGVKDKAQAAVSLSIQPQPQACDIRIGRDALSVLPVVLRDCKASAVGVLVSKKVARLHGKRLEGLLKETGLPFVVVEVPDGENAKRMAVAEKTCARFLGAGLDRSSVVLGFGGGTVCDLAGVVTGLFMRGVKLVLVPTTLLAMVDASVGGKSAVNLPSAKNAVGLFKQPLAVLSDSALLDTLPKRELLIGFAEAVKHGAIADKSLLEFIDAHAAQLLAREEPLLAEFIARNVRLKAALVEQDPFERGPRKALNFGHTLAHALEALGSFKGLSHGEAVAIGLCFEARLSTSLGGLSTEETAFLCRLLAKLGLPTGFPAAVDRDKLLARMAFDKKNAQGEIHFALPQTLGRMMDVQKGSRSVPRAKVKELLEAGA